MMGVFVAVGAALLVVIGSVLPWLSVSMPFGSISVSGTDGHLIGSSVDGTVTLILALVAGACFGLSVVTRERLVPIIGVVVACATAGIAIYNLIYIGSKIADAPSSRFGSASIGYGLWITGIAAIGMVVGSLKVPSAGPIARLGSTHPVARRSEQPAGAPESREYWVQDPFGRHELRWWNGNRYTDRVMDGSVESSDAPGRRAATVDG